MPDSLSDRPTGSPRATPPDVQDVPTDPSDDLDDLDDELRLDDLEDDHLDDVEPARDDPDDSWLTNPELTDAVRYTVNRWSLSRADPLPGVIAVVSSLPGEGVTTVAKALATLLRDELGRRACLLDLSASADDDDGFEHPGVWEVLRGSATARSALVHRGRGLATIGSGSAFGHDRHQLVHGAELDELVAELSSEFDHVVLDVPPVLTDTSSLALMRFVDAYLLVARQGSTTTAQVRSATEELRTVPTMGAILNRYRSRTPSFFRRLVSPS